MPNKHWRGFLFACAWGCLGGQSSALAAAASFDPAWLYLHGLNAAELLPGDDPDGDGWSNLEESLAGTDPRDAADALRVWISHAGEDSLAFTVSTKPGKAYQLQWSDSPAGPHWTDEGGLVAADTTTLVLNAGLGSGSSPRFYRVRVQDQDSDADGVSDWAERHLGTDPEQAFSANNASGGTASDGDTLRSLLSLSFEAVAGEEEALEKEAKPARLRLTRGQGLMRLTLPWQKLPHPNTRRGTASTQDYTLSVVTPGGSVTGLANGHLVFPAGASSLDILVHPVADSLPEVPEALRLSLISSAATPYPAPVEATATIVDADPADDGNAQLFVAYLGRESGAVTSASGVATARVSGDRRSAILSLTFSNLSSPQNTAYLRVGTDQELQNLGVGQITGQVWQIRAAQTLITDQAMLDALFRGDLYVSVTTAQYSGGEIRGNLQPASGSVADPPTPPAPPAYGDTAFPNLAASGVENNPALDRDIVRFLTQATFGPTEESIQELRDLIAANGNDLLAGYGAWIDRQQNLALTPSPSLLKLVQAADVEEFILRGNRPSTFNADPQFNGGAQVWNNTSRTWNTNNNFRNNNHPNFNNRRREWWTLILQSRDQLRQRVAFALSQIFVISDDDTVVRNFHYGASRYWDQLAEGAFGNYRAVLEGVAYSPQMGNYLSHLKNSKAAGNISPDENFAREIMQLFTIGLVLRHPDGSLKLGPDGLPIATYDQDDISELARVFTGLSFSKAHSGGTGALVDNNNFYAGNGNRYWQGSWLNPMRFFPDHHDYEEKRLFTGKVGERVIPARALPYNQNKAINDLNAALVSLAGNPNNANYNGHPNTPVFVSRLLIQRFTTSNPSAGYLHRVATRFRETKGDLAQVIRAILLDYEARSLTHADGVSGHGKLKEPILHFAASLRALQSYTGAPLANLSTLTVPFTAAQSPVTTPYETAELNKFPAGAVRFRFPDTTANLAQTPQSAPSVFNWFLPDYVLPGPLATAGLVAPEFQVLTESNLVAIINFHYQFQFATLPPAANAGRGLNRFFNLSGYRNASGVQLSVPAYGINAGYFVNAQFNPSLQSPVDIETRAPHLLPEFAPLTTLYTETYNASIGDAPNPTVAQRQTAHLAALTATADRLDLLLAAGALKTRFGSAAAPNPRTVILANVSQITNNNRHSSDPLFEADVLVRVRNLAFLIATSPQALVLR